MSDGPTPEMNMSPGDAELFQQQQEEHAADRSLSADPIAFDANNSRPVTKGVDDDAPEAPDLGNPNNPAPNAAGITGPQGQPAKPQQSRQSLVNQVLGGPTGSPLKNILGHFLVGAAAGPGGGGFAGGFARGEGAGIQFDEHQQDRRNAKTQQDKDNQLKQDEFTQRQKESEAHISLATAQKMEAEQRMKHQDLEDFQSAATDGKAHVALATANENNIVGRDLTMHEVGDTMSKNKDTDLFHGATYEMTGVKPVLDATGKIIGHEPTYTIYKPDANITLNAATAADFSKNVAGGNLTFAEGQTMPREQFERMRALTLKAKADQFTQDKDKADLAHTGAQTTLAGAETNRANAEAGKARAEAANLPSKNEAKLNTLLDKEYTGVEENTDPVSGSKTSRRVLGQNAAAALPQINKAAAQFGIKYKLSDDGRAFVVDNGDHIQLKSGNEPVVTPPASVQGFQADQQAQQQQAQQTQADIEKTRLERPAEEEMVQSNIPESFGVGNPNDNEAEAYLRKNPNLKPSERAEIRRAYEAKQKSSQGPKKFVAGGVVYNIPPEKVNDFLRSHPGAQQQ